MSGAGDSDTPSTKFFAQRTVADRKVRWCMKRSDDRVDEDCVIGGKYTKRIADLVFKTGFADIDFDMPGFLL